MRRWMSRYCCSIVPAWCQTYEMFEFEVVGEDNMMIAFSSSPRPHCFYYLLREELILKILHQQKIPGVVATSMHCLFSPEPLADLQPVRDSLFRILYRV